MSDALTITTADGTTLAAELYTPVQPARGAALLVPAMGVPQSYYTAFATWLASQGITALTFDYRGTGRSRHGSLRAVDADIRTWAEQDTRAALLLLAERATGVPLTWIGHSLGGQTLPFVPEHTRLAKVLTVATGSGYWRENAEPLRRKVWIFWWLAVPALTPVFGYFPGKRIGMVGDLPRGVVMQWRKWCLQPDYAVGDGDHIRALYASVTAPITALSFTDDEMMSGRNTKSIHGFYTGASVSHRRIAPVDVGLRRIGHFGLFRSDMTPLWQSHVLPEIATVDGDVTWRAKPATTAAIATG